MALPLTLDAAKYQCKIPLTDTSVDTELSAYMVVAAAVFEQLSKRSLTAVIENDEDGNPIPNDAVLSDNEQAIAEQWLKLTVAHFYENRQPVITDVRAVSVEVPQTADFLMSLLRTPTI